MTEPESVYVTPTLFVGEPPRHLSRTVRVSSAAEAVALIESGATAILPKGRYDLADAVLAHFGLDEAARRRQITFGRTGRLRA
jgi:hypothetical protein